MSQTVVTELASPEDLLEVQILTPYPKSPESESLLMGPRNLYFNKPSKRLLCILKFKKAELRLLRASEDPGKLYFHKNNAVSPSLG